MLPIDDVLNLVKPGGHLSKRLKSFEPRKEQQEMLHNVCSAYNDNQIALIEAGTGTGKSVAYLIPALLWAKKNKERTVISTKTITLQEQLLHKDIPMLLKTLGLDLKVVLVKGMGNYLCQRKLHDTMEERLLLPEGEAHELEQIEKWNAATEEGSRSSLSFTPSFKMWERVNCENDMCNRNKCPFYNKCHFFRARKNAEDAQILVVNHHLLFADIAYREESDEKGLLPDYKRLIIDEAHHIEEVATEFFANRLNHLGVLRQLARLSSDRQEKAHGKLPLLKEKLVQKRGREIDLINSRLTLELPSLKKELTQLLNTVFSAYHLFLTEESEKIRLLPKHKQDAIWKEEVVPQTKELLTVFARYTQTILSIVGEVEDLRDEKLKEQTKGLLLDITAIASRLTATASLFKQFLADEERENCVSWIETQQLKTMTNIHLAEAKLDISKQLAETLFKKFSTVILCSATLTTNRNFAFIRKRLGITEENLPGKQIIESLYDAVFDYQKQALFAIPNDIPDPNHPEFFVKATEAIWEAIHSSRGNAFVLFTSYTMLKACYQSLAERLKQHRYIALKQGEVGRDQLLKTFRETEYSVLFATDSFWEGVDVAGEALRCVILVRLPFRPPTEPILEARTEKIATDGGNPFLEYTVPNAIVKFKQGFGRLIRNKTDRGCVVCLDTRLLSKSYGKLFLNSLPNCKQLFIPMETLQENMREFYRSTYHFVKKKP